MRELHHLYVNYITYAWGHSIYHTWTQILPKKIRRPTSSVIRSTTATFGGRSEINNPPTFFYECYCFKIVLDIYLYIN